MAQPEQWSGLRALWTFVKRIASMLLMGTAGAIVGGFTLGVATFYVYFIGLSLGLLVGFIAGLAYGFRRPARDATIIFVGPVSAAIPVSFLGAAMGWSSDLTAFAVLSVFSLGALLLAGCVHRIFDSAARYWLAVVLSITFTGSTFAYVVVKLYR